MKQKIQPVMLWFLFIVTIGGLFWAWLGWLVFSFMVFFLVLAYFKGRFWCANICPRGAFLDIILSKYSQGAPMHGFFRSAGFRWGVFVVFMAFFSAQIYLAPKNIAGLGFVFVRMCIITTLIAIFIGLPWKARSWCMVCPMGTLQGKIGEVGNNNRRG